jgi:hypothetical protein
LLRFIRKKRLRRLHERFRDLEYLERIDRDNDDARVEKEVVGLEHGISKAEIELETAKFLQDKVKVDLSAIYVILWVK